MRNRLSKSEIASSLQTKWAGKELIYLQETGSTNIEAKRLAEEGMPHGTLVIAEVQTLGKGRRGRSWFSSEGKAILMSMLLKPDMKPDKASMLTLVQALAVSSAIEEVCGLPAQIKWPNDILVNEKKICGILTEMNLDKEAISSIIIGTGINVNQDEFSEEIESMATSLKKETGREVAREKLIERVCAYFEYYFEIFMERQDLSAFLKEYNRHLISQGRQVRVLDPKGEFTGEALGINPTGELLVKKEDGRIVPVYAGEVSVRGIYGYV